jgi:hypothetical protein
MQGCCHRDTNTYPAIQNATGSIAIIPLAAFNIVHPFPNVPTGAVGGLDRRSGGNAIA